MPRTLALLVLLALAGCGAAHHPTDAQIARRAGLTLRDLPTGWRTVKPRRFINCPAFHQARVSASAHVRSKVFSARDDTEEASGYIFVFGHPETARSAFARLRSPATRRCVASALRHTVPLMAGVRLRGVTGFATRVDPLGDEQSGSRFVATFTYRGRRFRVYADLLAVRAGRGIAGELYVANDAPLDGRLRYDLTALTARRLARLQGRPATTSPAGGSRA